MRLRHLIPLLALLLFTTVAATCSQNVRGVGRGIEAGAIEVQREIESMRKAGEIEDDTAGKYKAIISEVASSAHDLSLIPNWNSMSRADKRRIVTQQIGYFAARARRLDEAGVLGIKSERARKRVEEYKRNFQRAPGVLRVIEASYPAEESGAGRSPLKVEQVPLRSPKSGSTTIAGVGGEVQDIPMCILPSCTPLTVKMDGSFTMTAIALKPNRSMWIEQ